MKKSTTIAEKQEASLLIGTTKLSAEEMRLINGSGDGDNGLPPKYTIKTHRPTQK